MATTIDPAVMDAQESLWDTALSKLGEKARSAFKDLGPHIEPDDLLNAVEERKKQCEEKQWRIPKSTVKVRDVLEKIARWFKKFIEIGDVAVQYDPAHAALPWAAVRFLLLLSVNDVQRYTIVLEGVETIAHLMVRCQIYENLYLNRQTEVIGILKRCMINLYTSIMKFFGEAIEYFQLSTTKRSLMSFVRFEDGFTTLLEQISGYDREVQDCTSHVQHDESKTELLSLSSNQREGFHDMNTKMDDLSVNDIKRSNELNWKVESLSLEGKYQFDHMVSKLENILGYLNGPVPRLEGYSLQQGSQREQDERLRILQWLSPHPYLANHKTTRQGILQGTGTWFLESDKVLDWQRSSASSVLWLHGIPGSGKSKLTSLLIDQHAREFEKGLNPRPAYFYCARNNSEKARSNPQDIIGSIIRQICCLGDKQPVLPPVQDMYDDAKEQGFVSGPPSLDEGIALIIALTARRPITTILIDALDEVDKDDRHELLCALQRILQESSGLVKLFVSSRNDQQIVTHLNGCPNIEINITLNQKDIYLFVNSRVEEAAKGKLLFGEESKNIALLQKIKKTLLRGAQGMFVLYKFLWVELQLQFLCTLKTTTTVERRLGSLPHSLSKIYEDLHREKMNDCDEEDQIVTEHIFRWLLCSQKPMHSLELTAAIAAGCSKHPITEKIILDMAFNLVVLDKETNVFRFAHLSVREYLESKDRYLAKFNHEFAAKVCLTTLMRPNMSTGDVFLYYADEFWPSHLMDSEAQRHKGELKALVFKFMLEEEKSSFNRWSSGMLASPSSRRKKIMSYDEYKLYGVKKDQWWQRDYGALPALKLYSYVPLKMNGDPTCSLFAACSLGLLEIVREYLKYRESVNVQNQLSKTALILASSVGHEEIVQLLLEHKADVNLQDENSETALMLAVQQGLNAENIVQVLLEHNADVNVENWQSQTALTMAVQQGQKAENVIQMLLEYNADVNIHYWPNSPLITAVQQGQRAEKVVQLLLEHNAFVNVKNWEFDTALMLAVRQGSETENIIRMLLEHKADVNIENPRSETALMIALQQGPKAKKIVDTLLEYNADINILDNAWKHSQSDFGLQVNTTLFPSFHYYKSAAQELLGIGATKYTLGQRLVDAVRLGSKEIVEILLNYGVDPNAQDSSQNTALIIASRRGDNIIAQLLLSHGADPNVKCAYFTTPLNQAFYHGCITVVHLLLSHGAKLDNLGKEILDLALSERHGPILQLLRRRRGTKKLFYDTLMTASSSGLEEEVELLLDCALDVNVVRSGRTPLQAASSRGKTGVVRLLLERGADVGSQGGKALRLAREVLYTAKSREETVQLLLAKGAVED